MLKKYLVLRLKFKDTDTNRNGTARLNQQIRLEYLRLKIFDNEN